MADTSAIRERSLRPRWWSYLLWLLTGILAAFAVLTWSEGGQFIGLGALPLIFTLMLWPSTQNQSVLAIVAGLSFYPFGKLWLHRSGKMTVFDQLFGFWIRSYVPDRLPYLISGIALLVIGIGLSLFVILRRRPRKASQLVDSQYEELLRESKPEVANKEEADLWAEKLLEEITAATAHGAAAGAVPETNQADTEPIPPVLEADVKKRPETPESAIETTVERRLHLRAEKDGSGVDGDASLDVARSDVTEKEARLSRRPEFDDWLPPNSDELPSESMDIVAELMAALEDTAVQPAVKDISTAEIAAPKPLGSTVDNATAIASVSEPLAEDKQVSSDVQQAKKLPPPPPVVGDLTARNPWTSEASALSDSEESLGASQESGLAMGDASPSLPVAESGIADDLRPDVAALLGAIRTTALTPNATVASVEPTLPKLSETHPSQSVDVPELEFPRVPTSGRPRSIAPRSWREVAAELRRQREPLPVETSESLPVETSLPAETPESLPAETPVAASEPVPVATGLLAVSPLPPVAALVTPVTTSVSPVAVPLDPAVLEPPVAFVAHPAPKDESKPESQSVETHKEILTSIASEMPPSPATQRLARMEAELEAELERIRLLSSTIGRRNDDMLPPPTRKTPEISEHTLAPSGQVQEPTISNASPISNLTNAERSLTQLAFEAFKREEDTDERR